VVGFAGEAVLFIFPMLYLLYRQKNPHADLTENSEQSESIKKIKLFKVVSKFPTLATCLSLHGYCGVETAVLHLSLISCVVLLHLLVSVVQQDVKTKLNSMV
jgi:hypothetical protein